MNYANLGCVGARYVQPKPVPVWCLRCQGDGFVLVRRYLGNKRYLTTQPCLECRSGRIFILDGKEVDPNEPTA